MTEAQIWTGLLKPVKRRISPQVKLQPGQQVGEWKLLEYRPGAKKPERVAPRWYCRCSCGAERWVRSANLLSGQSKSCGHAYPGGWRLPAGNPVT